MGSIEPRQEQLRDFLEQSDDGKPIVMINLLRYREQAEYPDGFEAEPCSGKEAYDRYSEVALQKVLAVGGKPIWMGSVQLSLIGPEGERWDDAFLVQYPTRKAFLEMVSMPEYQAIAVHRTAALADSRLIATIAMHSEVAGS